MTNLTVLTQDNETFNVTVDSYDPVAINTQINDNSLITIVLGDLIFSRLDIKRVEPVEGGASGE